VIRPLIELEREKPRNARLWDGSVPDVDVTPVADVKNASTRADAFRGDAVITTVREDLFKRPEPRTETGMPRDTKDNIEARRIRLRAHLEVHGPATRSDLREALGYESLSPLLSDLAAIGAGPTERNGRTVALASQVPDERPTKRRKAEPVAETATEPVRPSLAADAIRYLREGAEGPGVILPVEYCRALVARL